jgi:hypothetical protein
VYEQGGFLYLEVLDTGASPAAIVRDFRAAGIEADEQATPTGPSRVGRFVGLLARGEGLTASAGKRVRVPVGWSGAVAVLAGSPAGAGELYEAHTDAFAEGEPLHCLARPGDTVRDVRRVASGAGVAIVWFDNGTGQPVDDASVEETWRVLRATAAGPQNVLAYVAPRVEGEAPTSCG